MENRKLLESAQFGAATQLLRIGLASVFAKGKEETLLTTFLQHFPKEREVAHQKCGGLASFFNKSCTDEALRKKLCKTSICRMSRTVA